MAGLDEFRKQFDVGEGMSDAQLEEKIYNKFFSGDMSREEFHAKITKGYEGESVKPYVQTDRDKIASFLLEPTGREQDSDVGNKELGRKIVKGLVGSEGLGTTNPALIDFVPGVGSHLAVNEMQKHADEGDAPSAMLDALGAAPMVGAPVKTASKWVADKARFPFTEAAKERTAAGRVARAGQEDMAQRIQSSRVTGPVARPVAQQPYTPEDVNPRMLELTRNSNRTLLGGTPEQVKAMRLVDYGGRSTANEFRASVNLSPRGAQASQDFIPTRFADQVERIRTWFGSRFGNAEASLQRLEAEREAGKTPISREYQTAYKDGDRDIITPTLVAMLGNPDIAAALKAGESALALQEAGSGIAYRASGGTQPTLAMWDQVKRVMDGYIGEAQRKGNEPLARNWILIKNRLVAELDEQVPSYAKARGVAADYFHAATAFEAGQEVVKGKWPRGEIQSVTKRMDPAELAEFREGFLYDYLNDTIKGIGDRENVTAKIMQNPIAREKIYEVLGPEAFGEFQTVLAVEQTIDQARLALANSTTAQQTSEMKKRAAGPGMALPAVVGGMGAIGTSLVTGDWKALAAGSIAAGLTRIAQQKGEKISEDIAHRVVTMLLDDKPEVYRKGLKEVLQYNPPLARAFNHMGGILATGTRGAAVPYTSDQPDKGIFGTSQPTAVKSVEEARKLPPGTWVRTPDGRVGKVKPSGRVPSIPVTP